MRNKASEIKVGIFALVLLAFLGWVTVRVSDRSAISGGGYDLSFTLPNATGLKTKAPIELAGVAVGMVKEVQLNEQRQAIVEVRINDKIKLPKDTAVLLRTRGFLGETYVEILPGKSSELLRDNDTILKSEYTGDINSLVSDFSGIAKDFKNVSSNMSEKAGQDPNAPVNQIITNLHEFSKAIRDVTIRNSENIDRIAANMANLTAEISRMVENSRANIESGAQNISDITGKINRGEGTIGKLVNDEATVNKLNDSLDSLNDTLGGYSSMETQLGFHTEYLNHSSDFKNYVDVALRPSPDKALLVGVSTDPNPRASHVLKTTDITANNVTNTVTTDTATVSRDSLKVSAQLAKSFYDFTVRGGIIESRGGMGMDYKTGPLSLSFSAFDFANDYNERPHLKALADVSVTKNLFVVGGADDMVSKLQKTDYFIGAGFRFVDDDLKKFARFGGSSLMGK